MKYRNILWAGVMVVAVAIATPGAQILEQVLVKVNGEIITKTDLEQRQIAALRQRNPNFRPDSDAALQKALAEVTPGVIVEAVDEMLMVQRGKELGYTMTTERFNSIVENIKKENKIESDEALQAALKQEGMTMADLRRQLEKTMMVQQVQQTEILQKLQVTDTEMQAYYDAHKNEFAHRAADHAARDHDQRAGHRARRQRGARRCREGEGGGSARQDRCRRAVSASGRRLFRLGLEGERRPGRAVGAKRFVRRTAESHCRPEDRRRDAGAADDARLSDHQDREPAGHRRSSRSKTRAPRSPTRSPTKSARANS